MESVKWGVVGVGDVCERKSGPPLYLVNNSSLELVHRRSREEGEEFVIRHGRGRYIESFDELIGDPGINAVYVATPHEFHEQQTIAALEAGKHVLVEKPMALDTGGCDRMIAAAVRADRLLAVAYYRRGYPSIKKVKSILESGLIGIPIAASINNEFPTSHRLDLIHYLLGNIAEVTLSAAGEDAYAPESHDPLLTLRSERDVTVTHGKGMAGDRDAGKPDY